RRPGAAHAGTLRTAADRRRYPAGHAAHAGADRPAAPTGTRRGGRAGAGGPTRAARGAHAAESTRPGPAWPHAATPRLRAKARGAPAMNDDTGLARLYPAHLAELCRRSDAALAAAGRDHLLIAS